MASVIDPPQPPRSLPPQPACRSDRRCNTRPRKPARAPRRNAFSHFDSVQSPQMSTNNRIVLAARPTGFPAPTDFRMEERPVLEPAEGEFLVAVSYLSVDPYMRGRMNDAPSYAPPQKLDEVMVGGGVGRVIATRHPKFAVGDYAVGMFGWQQYALSDGQGVMKVDPAAAPISTALGVLGMPGLTAYFGLLDVCAPRAGETVVVSGAAGAVGSAVGQIAKIHGCRVIGIAGGEEKTRWITNDLGFDAAIDYKAE